MVRFAELTRLVAVATLEIWGSEIDSYVVAFVFDVLCAQAGSALDSRQVGSH